MRTRRRYPWLQLADGAHWPTGVAGRRLLRKANRTGRDLRRVLWIESGRRTAYEAWELYQRYLNGTGNLAAPCCWRRYRHTWNACGKTPTSFHAQSKALDVGVIGKSGKYHSLGLYKGAEEAANRHGLHLWLWNTLGKEPWHLTERRFRG